MGYDEELANRIRELIAADPDVTEQRMFGGLAFLIGGKTPGRFSVRRTDNFDISDAVLLPAGDLLLLERKFSWLAGVGIRIRRIALKSVAPGAVVDGPSIFDADLGHEIDNMEGIDAHVTPEGDTVLIGGRLVETREIPAVRFYPDGTCDRFRAQLRTGAMMFAGFVASAIVIGWLMYPLPL